MRVSTGEVPLGRLRELAAAYEHAVLPLYASCDGFLGAELLCAGVPPGASWGTLLATAASAARRDCVAVRAVSRWESSAALAAAQDRVTHVMQTAIAPLFSTPPTGDEWASLLEGGGRAGVGMNSGVRDSSAAEDGAGGQARSGGGTPAQMLPGKELGLR